jgi:hypothetical protein
MIRVRVAADTRVDDVALLSTTDAAIGVQPASRATSVSVGALLRFMISIISVPVLHVKSVNLGINCYKCNYRLLAIAKYKSYNEFVNPDISVLVIS